VSQLDRHLTTEQLSALLDNQLSPDESKESYQAHLQTCEQCQQELAGLRQTVRLLRELPQPPLPRSFTLPATFSLLPTTSEAAVSEPQEHKDQTSNPVIPIGTRRVRRFRVVPARRRSLQTAMSMVSGLVAVIGICFMLTALLGVLPGATHSSGTSTASNSSIMKPNSTKAGSVKGYGGPHGAMTPQVVAAPTPSPSHESTPHSEQGTVTPSEILPIFSFFDISTTIGGFRLGFLLLVLGIVGFYLFKQRYRPQVVPVDRE
jgi:exonuclease VII small subunit